MYAFALCVKEKKKKFTDKKQRYIKQHENTQVDDGNASNYTIYVYL